MDVSVIIVNYNTRDLLRDCLTSIIEKTKDISYEVIVVDNASTDHSLAMVRLEFPGVITIDAGENLGFGRANNVGALSASGDYLFFLNSDTMLLNNAITELWSFISASPKCGIVGGNLTDRSGTPIHSHSKKLPSPWSSIFHLFPCITRLLYGKNWTYNHSKKPLRVGYVTGADLMIHRNLFENIGGFDPDFFMYYEETELTHRVRRLGYLVFSIPTARIMHIKGGSLDSLLSVKNVVLKSKYTYMKKVYGNAGMVKAHLAMTIFCVLKIVVHSFSGKTKSRKRFQDILRTDRSVYRSMHI